MVIEIFITLHVSGETMNYKNDSSIHHYLGEIDSGPLLSKLQEMSLIRDIEVFQKQILEACLSSEYSKFELLSYLRSLQSSGESIVDISKKLDDESDKERVAELHSKFETLISALDSNNIETVRFLLDEVGLTGTIIHGITLEIKKKFSQIFEYESKLKPYMTYFELTSYTEILDQVNHHRLNPISIHDISLQNKCREFDEVKNLYETCKSFLPEPITFEDVKDFHKRIYIFEFKMQKFKNELIERNLRLVISRARKFLNKGLEFEDLIQEGNIGLMKAVDKFDSSKKTRISTYATWWIDQSIRRAISNKGKTVRIPTHIEFMQTNLNQLKQVMTGELKREPTTEELSIRSGIDLKTLYDLEVRAQYEVGIDEEFESGKSLMEVIPSDSSENPFNLVEKRLLKEKIKNILSTLNPRTEKIIRLRFGIGEIPDEELTLQEIGDQIGITKQGIRNHCDTALKKLKKRVKGLEDE